MNATPESRGRDRVPAAIAILLLLALLCFAAGVYILVTDPGYAFLTEEGGARWIRFNGSVLVGVVPSGQQVSLFRTQVTVSAPVSNAVLHVRAMKGARVLLDGQELLATNRALNAWKRTYEVDMAPSLAPGTHELRLMVFNLDGPTCVLAYCPALDLYTDDRWEASQDDVSWTHARFADVPKPYPLSREFPSVGAAFRAKAPIYALIFLGVFALTLWGKRIRGIGAFRVTPSHVRWLALAAWAALAVNNMFRLTLDQGLDVAAHCQYIAYLIEHKRIPLANDGWQMFQSPLYYLVSAPLLVAFSKVASIETAWRLLRIVPLAAGLAQVEICYRALRYVYPARKDLQIIGTLLGGFIPMNLYISQYVSNEAPAGFLTAVVVLLSLKLLHQPRSDHWVRSLIPLGACLGLALLTKITPVLLIFPLGMLLSQVCFAQEGSPRRAFRNLILGLAAIAGVAFLISGWYYIRNYWALGRPFIGGWDAARGIVWWQDPGYRTPGDFVRFGEALCHPIYSGLMGFWDGIYSTFWMDAFASGSTVKADCPTWHYNYMISGMWWALLPTAAIVFGLIRSLARPVESAPSGLLFAAFCVCLYGAALLYHFVTNPFYCAVKAFYTIGMIPCYAALGASGMDLITRSGLLRAGTYAGLACWLASAYIGHFAW